jgi:hypothetical protein
MATKKRGNSRPSVTVRSEDPPPYGAFIVTTVRLRRDQWNALRQAAQERALAEGGKADASAVLRELIDAWIRRQ